MKWCLIIKHKRKKANLSKEKLLNLLSNKTIQKENLVEFYLNNPFPVYKLNLYHQSSKSRQRTYNRIQETYLYV